MPNLAMGRRALQFLLKVVAWEDTSTANTLMSVLIVVAAALAIETQQ